MYLWNTRALATELKDGTLSQRERFKYYLLGTVAYASAVELLSYYPEESTILNISNSVITIAITIFGIVWCYIQNQAGEGHEFIDRMVCLSVPVVIRFTALLVPLFLITQCSADMIRGLPPANEPVSTTWYEVAILALWECAIYWRVGVHMRWIASDSSDLELEGGPGAPEGVPTAE